MSRANFQVLILPFKKEKDNIKYCIFKRKDRKIWQFISGGGEDNENIIEAAIREVKEETGINVKENIFKLDSICSIPADIFKNHEELWGKDCFVIPEYTFGLELKEDEIILSDEHLEFIWTDYKESINLLQYDSNRTALYELNKRILIN